uniref:GRIP domain-containing protein n=2 Tax=Panagrellus redivivus TaxID=6233 RepID=A0A7E4VUA1_PANRE
MLPTSLGSFSRDAIVERVPFPISSTMTSTGPQPFSNRGKPLSELDQYQDENLPEGFAKLYSKLPADDEMKACYEELKTEVLVLTRQLPQLKDAHGKDVTKQIIGLHEQLRKERLDREKLEARIAELDRRPRISEWNDGETSIVSQFTLDRESARRVAESVRGNNDSDNFKSIHDDQCQSLMTEVAGWKDRYEDLAYAHEEEKDRLQNENQALAAELAKVKAELNANMAQLAEAKDKLVSYTEAHQIEMTEYKKTVNNVPDAATQELQERVAKLTAEVAGFNEEVLKRDKVIRGFNKICWRSLNKGNTDAPADENVDEKDTRKVLVRTLYATFDLLDEFWKQREALVAEVKAFIESGEETGRYSTINDKLNKDREALERQLVDMTCDDETSISSFNPRFEVNAECSIDLVGNKSMFNSTADISDLQYVQRCYAELKDTCQTLFSRLQESANFLIRLTSALQNSTDPTSMALLKKIQALKLNVTINEASAALNNANEAERSMNATIERASIRGSMSSSYSGIPTLQSENAAEHAASKGKVVELENQLAEMERTMAEVRTELSVRTSEVETLKKKLENYKNDVTSLDQLLAEQRRATDKAEFERDELRAQFAMMEEKQEADDGKTHEALVEAQKQLEALTEAQKNHQAEVVEIQNALTAAKKEAATMTSNLRKEQSEVKKLTEELAVTHKKYDEIAAERDMKSQIAEAAEKKLRTTVDQRAREHEKDLAKLRGALEKMTQSCNSYDAYLKAVVAKALSRDDDDDAVIELPECIDASVHNTILNVVSAPKKLEAVQAIIDSFDTLATHDHETTIMSDPASGDVQVTEVIERVSKSKDVANNLVQSLKKLINEPKNFLSFAARLLEWARENRETLFAVLAHLEAVKAKNENLVSTIINEMQEISTVLRQADQLRMPKKHHHHHHRTVRGNRAGQIQQK